MPQRFLEYIVTEVKKSEGTHNGGLFDKRICGSVSFKIDEIYFGEGFNIGDLAREITSLLGEVILLDSEKLIIVDHGEEVNSHLYAISTGENPILGGIGMIGCFGYGMPNSKVPFHKGGVQVNVFSPNLEYISILYLQLNQHPKEIQP